MTQNNLRDTTSLVKSQFSGSFPERGCFELAEWAAFFRCEDRTAKEWLRERDIPGEPGMNQTLWFEAADIRAAMKRDRKPLSETPSNRGGARPRKKKED